MRKVPIIGYFRPYRSGSGHILGLAEYFPEFGCMPIILTAPLDVEPFATEAGDNLLKKEDVRATTIIWPVTSHLVTKELGDRYRVPWIADFRDP